jgi:hypothetical protein
MNGMKAEKEGPTLTPLVVSHSKVVTLCHLWLTPVISIVRWALQGSDSRSGQRSHALLPISFSYYYSEYVVY